MLWAVPWNGHNSIPSPPEPWELWEMSLTSLLCHDQRGKAEMYPLGSGVKKGERFWGGGKTVATRNFWITLFSSLLI